LEIADNQDDTDRVAAKFQFHIILLDLRYPLHAGDENSELGFQGMSWLPTLRKIQPDAAIIVLTAYPDVPNAVEAVRDGHANDFVSKTEPWEVIIFHIRNAWRSIPSFKQAASLRQEFWTMLRSQALRVHFGEILSGIRRCQIQLETTASRIDSGDATAIKAAPAQIRAACERLENGFTDATEWLSDANSQDGGKRRMPPPIDIVKDLLKPLPFLYGAEVQIDEHGEQSISISTYAADLKISLHEVIRNSLEAQSTRVLIRAMSKAGGAVIEVKDNGPGLAPGVADSLYQKGFTTHRGDPRHNGMGLYLANRLMRDLNGTIDIRTVAEGGVLATLTVPDLEAAP